MPPCRLIVGKARQQQKTSVCAHTHAHTHTHTHTRAHARTGAFGSVGKVRDEIVLEGTRSGELVAM